MDRLRHPPARGRRPRSRRGFVLLMSLMLLALAAILLVRLARRSLAIAQQSQDARLAMQERWGRISLSRALLGRTEGILAYRAAGVQAGTRAAERIFPLVENVRLGGIDFRVIMDDEDRKLNINRLYTTGGTERVFQTLQRLGHSSARLTLRPKSGISYGISGAPFESWGQVYALDHIAYDKLPAQWLLENTRDVTCWGNGRVHYSRSSDDVLEVAAELAAGPVTAKRLLGLRHGHPTLSLEEVLKRLDAPRRETDRLKGWLTDRSQCFSLWIVTEGQGPNRYDLSLAQTRTSGPPQVQRFTW